MKRLLLFLIFPISAFLLFVSCISENADTENPAFVNAENIPETKSVVSDTDSAVTDFEESSAPVSEETPESTSLQSETEYHLELPEEFFDHSSANCSSVSVPKEYNPGLYCDLEVITDKKAKTVTVFLPCSADRKQFVFALHDSDGSIKRYIALDISDNGENAEKAIKINKQTYDFIFYQSDSPSLIINLDEQYGNFKKMISDSNHTLSTYGDLIITTTEEKAEKYDWDIFYESIENDPDSPCSMRFKGRGNVSWKNCVKKSFGIKLEKKMNVLGMGSEKNWILIPCMNDVSMLRNQLAYTLSKEIGVLTPDYVLIDAFINGHYNGSYLLAEKTTVDVNRVDIDSLEKRINSLSDGKEPVKGVLETLENGVEIYYYKGVPDPEDITGGYIIEKMPERRVDNSETWFKTTNGTIYVTKSPEKCSRNQMIYISTFVEDTENAFYSKDGICKRTGKYYTDYLDIDSYILKYWLDEIMRNTDSQGTSAYFYKPTDSQSTKLYTGPAWDFDNTITYNGDNLAEEWFAITAKAYHKKLFKHEDFKERAIELFKEKVSPAFKKMTEGGIYDELFEDSRDSIMMNYTVVGSEDYDAVYKFYINWLSKRVKFFKVNMDFIKEY